MTALHQSVACAYRPRVPITRVKPAYGATVRSAMNVTSERSNLDECAAIHECGNLTWQIVGSEYD
ncbi:hypothetical protein CBOM_00598 [Ceraceosorus bombacis]|uniref:Uncharacterized protein n=1 Tax=Ceraceosorus bombacis TaxID=401625 RepID=A0A0P1A379_9BASI|nr:hypothetical protein CBOM_00598 [Ceraceosorus bombacis]